MNVQGFVSKLAVPTARRLSSGALPGDCARRLSSGSLPGLPSNVPAIGFHTSSAPANTAANTVRRHSLSSFEATLSGWSNARNSFPSASFTSYPCEITWLAGAPGAGKGTNSGFVATARGYDAPTIVMSSLLESPECKRIKDAGGMVDDEVVFQALLKELAKPKYRHGVVVDGFPRTQKQVEMISKWYDSVGSKSTTKTSFNFVTLFIDEQASVARQLSRGDSIRKLNEVRKTSGLPALEERATDVCEKAARIRYSNFLQQYEAINKLSARFHSVIVDASAPIDAVRQSLNSVCAQFPTPANHQIRRTSIPTIIIEEQQQQLAYA